MSLLQAINEHLNGGRCPTREALGECCAISEVIGCSGHPFYVASLYLWPAAERLKPAEVAEWFGELGCTGVTVSAILHDPYNGFINGRHQDDGVRPWEVSFSLPQPPAVAPAKLAAKLDAADECPLPPAEALIDRLLKVCRDEINCFPQRTDSGIKDALRAALSAHASTQTDAARDVLAERRRQVEAEGWTPEHDDEHDAGELAAAACAYAALAADQLNPMSQGDGGEEVPMWWPWEPASWKPSDPRRNLVKAAALILAEIERRDRASRGQP